MWGAIHVATVRGIPVKIHLSALVVLLILISNLGSFGAPAAALLFGSVFLHELGHSLVALRYGIPITAIHLHMLGGTAMMAGSPEHPDQEIKIALAGPAVSLLIGVTGLIAGEFLGPPQLIDVLNGTDLLGFLSTVNLGIGIFNLLPALPMDGGRVFRALLQKRCGELRATVIAARVSRLLALMFVLVGIVEETWTLPLIGIALLVMAGKEVHLARARDAIRRMREEEQLIWPVLPEQIGSAHSWDRLDRFGKGHEVIVEPLK